MGKDYLFKISVKGNKVEEGIYKQINSTDLEYIMYNDFLVKNYAIDIEENEDYIAYVNKDTAIIILNEELFDKNELENVFEILYDSLYMNRGEKYEEDNNYKWVSNFR